MRKPGRRFVVAFAVSPLPRRDEGDISVAEYSGGAYPQMGIDSSINNLYLFLSVFVLFIGLNFILHVNVSFHCFARSPFS
jgi:hypothetical protein